MAASKRGSRETVKTFAKVGDHLFYTQWSEEDKEWVGLCCDFPSLSWLDEDQKKAFDGIVSLVDEVKEDMSEDELKALYERMQKK